MGTTITVLVLAPLAWGILRYGIGRLLVWPTLVWWLLKSRPFAKERE